MIDIRTGNGFDVHRFAPGRRLVICGVEIPFDGTGLLGHSDADVAIHALCDAILGALALGDIGSHFPDTDPRWSGVDSRILLRAVAAMASEKGYTLSNADVTVIAQAPKMAPHIDAMRRNLADDLGIDTDRISVKATTTERLGFTGRREGIASLATVTLIRCQ